MKTATTSSQDRAELAWRRPSTDPGRFHRRSTPPSGQERVHYTDFGTLDAIFDRPFGPVLNMIALVLVWLYQAVGKLLGWTVGGKGKRGFYVGEQLARGKGPKDMSSTLFVHNSEIDQAAKEGDLGRAEEALHNMLEAGVAPNAFSYSTLVKLSCKGGQDPRKASKYMNLLLDAGMMPEPLAVKQLLEAHAKANDMQRIEGLMRRLRAIGFQQALGMTGYQAAIEVCARTGDKEQGKLWVNRIVEAYKKGHECTKEEAVQSFSAASLTLSKGKLTDLASELLVMAEQAGLMLDVAAYEALVKALSRLNVTDQAEFWLEHLLSLGLKPDVDAYHAVMHSLAQSAEKDRVEAWLYRMPVRGKAGGQSPNSVSYNIVIDAFAKANDSGGAEKWLSKMKEAGLSPSAVSYNAVIHACARAGDVERAAGWLVAVRRDPTAPEVNVFTWSTVIHACAKAGDADGAELWLSRMHAAGVAATAVTYNCVIDACARCGERKRSEQWLRRMQDEGVDPTPASYNSVIHACAEAGDAEGAEDWLLRMSEEGKVLPTAHSFGPVIHAWGTAGKPERAQAIFDRMQAAGVRGSVVIYSSLARPHARKGNWQEVESILEAMEKDGIQ